MPQQPWICVSPDGVVVENECITKILEIKCPSSCHSKPVYDSVNEKFNVGYLYMHKGDVHLKESNKYYTQCQTLMYPTGLTQCDLYVWSPKGSSLVNVYRDEKFLSILVPKTKDFYFTYLLPALYEKNTEENKENNSVLDNTL